MSAMDEDDIYGDDIYGGVSELGTDAAIPSSNGVLSQMGIKAEQPSELGRPADSSFQLGEQNASLQGQHQAAQASLEDWQNTFQPLASSAGLPLEPAALLAHLQQTHQQPAVTASTSSNAAEDISALRQRESQLQAQLMDKILENMELRRHLQSAKAAAEPAVVQVRALLLDPAVNREFQRVHKALEDKTEEAKRLHEELQGTLFSQESKQGRMLVAKCRTLAEENEEIGRELSEDRVHKLERQLALAKSYAEDMQAAYQECEDHATALDEEAERLQEEVFEAKRKLQDASTLVPRHLAFRLNDGVAPRAGPRDGNRPFIPYNNPRHMQSPPMQRPYMRRPPVDSGPPPKRGMAPDRRDEGDRYSSRPRVR